MDCSVCREQFPAYFDNQVEGDSRRTFIDHLRTCTPCRSAYLDYERSLGIEEPGISTSEPRRSVRAVNGDDNAALATAETTSEERSAIFDLQDALSLDAEEEVPAYRTPRKPMFSLLVVGLIIGVVAAWATRSWWAPHPADPTEGLVATGELYLTPAEASMRSNSDAVWIEGSWNTREQAVTRLTGMTPTRIASLSGESRAVSDAELETALRQRGYETDGHRWFPAGEFARLEGGQVFVSGHWVSAERIEAENRFLRELEAHVDNGTFPVSWLPCSVTALAKVENEFTYGDPLYVGGAFVVPILFDNEAGTGASLLPRQLSRIELERLREHFGEPTTEAEAINTDLKASFTGTSISFLFGAGGTVFGIELNAASDTINTLAQFLVAASGAEEATVNPENTWEVVHTLAIDRTAEQGAFPIIDKLRQDRGWYAKDAGSGLGASISLRDCLPWLPMSDGVANRNVLMQWEQTQSGDATARAAGIDILAREYQGNALDQILPFLDDPTIHVQRAAARALTRHLPHTEEAWSRVSGALKDATDPEVVHSLVVVHALGWHDWTVPEALVDAGNPRRIRTLLTSLASVRPLIPGRQFRSELESTVSDWKTRFGTSHPFWNEVGPALKRLER